MALAFTGLTSGFTQASNPVNTASVSPAAGSMVLLGVFVCTEEDTGAATDALSVSGLGLTWTKVGTVGFGAGSSCRVWIYRGTGTPSSGAVTLEYTGDPTWFETHWHVIQVSGHDTTTPNDAATTNFTEDSPGTSIAAPDVGTPGTGDAVFAIVGVTTAGVNPAPGTGTELYEIDAGGVDLTSMTWYDASAADETPQASWTGTEDSGIVACIVNVAAAPAASGHYIFLPLLGVG